MIDFGLYAAYTLIGICVLAILLFAITNIAKSPAKAKSALIGIGGLVVVFLITYFTSTGADATTIFADENISEETSRWVGMGLSSFYVLAGLAILSIAYVEITRLFK